MDPNKHEESKIAEDGRNSPSFEVIDEGRVKIKYAKGPKYRPGQQVYVRIPGSANLEGPYLVASVNASSGKYTLSFFNGATAKNGSEVAEDDLVAA